MRLFKEHKKNEKNSIESEGVVQNKICGFTRNANKFNNFFMDLTRAGN